RTRSSRSLCRPSRSPVPEGQTEPQFPRYACLMIDAPEVPDLRTVDGVLFDLDGVLTPTAEVHMRAWQAMFDELFSAWNITPPYTERDYFEYVDGKKRYD